MPFFGSKLNHDLPIDSQGFQLTTTPVTFPPTDNSTDYTFIAGCITARSNASYEGTTSPEEALRLELADILNANPDLAQRLDGFPNRIFSGREAIEVMVLGCE